LIQNVIFFELAVFILLRVFALITSAGLRSGNPVSHLFGSLRRTFGLFFAMYFGYHSLDFYNYMKTIGDLNDNGTVTTKRSQFNIWLAWGVCFYVQIEIIWAVIEVMIAASKGNINKSRAYEETGNPRAISNANVELSYNSILDEVAFMYQNKNIAC
jgi:hypothetical protein